MSRARIGLLLCLLPACGAPGEPADEPEAVEVIFELPPALGAGPRAASRISPRARAVAGALMGAGAVEGRCGPYELLTDVPGPVLESLCSTVVARVDAAYTERFRREPRGSAAETLLIFGRGSGFREFAASTSRWRVEATGRASAAEGYLALGWEGRSRDELATTLVHELTHLVNRRALGAALPAWLEEGMADDLAEVLLGGKYESALWQLGMDRAAGDLLPLVEFVDLSTAGFYGGRGYSNYAQALAAVRFFSKHPELAAGFERFLDALAAGGGYSPELLSWHLGRSWNELQANWDAWGRGHHQDFPRFTESDRAARG